MQKYKNTKIKTRKTQTSGNSGYVQLQGMEGKSNVYLTLYARPSIAHPFYPAACIKKKKTCSLVRTSRKYLLYPSPVRRLHPPTRAAKRTLSKFSMWVQYRFHTSFTKGHFLRHTMPHSLLLKSLSVRLQS
jgi:hypothetical protein